MKTVRRIVAVGDAVVDEHKHRLKSDLRASTRNDIRATYLSRSFILLPSFISQVMELMHRDEMRKLLQMPEKNLSRQAPR